MDKFGENVDNFVEKTVEKSEKKEFPIVDNMEKTNEEQADKSVEEDEKFTRKNWRSILNLISLKETTKH